MYNEAVFDMLALPHETHKKLQIQMKGKELIIPVSVSSLTAFCGDQMLLLFQGPD